MWYKWVTSFLRPNQKVRSISFGTLLSMHGSLNVLAQALSKIVVRSSLQTEPSVPSKDASSKPLPPISHGVPRREDVASIATLPVTGSFVNLCEREVPPEDAPNHYSTRSRRKPTEMPLSTHPPFRKSWIEVHPFKTHDFGQNVRPRAEIHNSNSTGPSLKHAVIRKESTGAMTTRPYHGIILPSPPPIPDTRQRRTKPHDQPSVALSQDTTPTALCDQPIAPLTPRHRKVTTQCPARPPCLSGISPIQARRNPAKQTSSWVDEHPLSGDSLQLEIFSELDVELNEAMILYTASEMP